MKDKMFEGIKIGDRVYDWTFGWGTVNEICLNDTYPIRVVFDRENGHVAFTFDGRYLTSDKNPTLFWDEPKLEIPKKPFNLKSEYKKLQRKEFVYGETNCIISLDSDYGEISWDWDYYEYRQEIGVCYYQKESIQDFIDILNDNKVTFDELEKVVKEVEDEDRRD